MLSVLGDKRKYCYWGPDGRRRPDSGYWRSSRPGPHLAPFIVPLANVGIECRINAYVLGPARAIFDKYYTTHPVDLPRTTGVAMAEVGGLGPSVGFTPCTLSTFNHDVTLQLAMHFQSNCPLLGERTVCKAIAIYAPAAQG